MVGDALYDLNAKITGQRVLPGEAPGDVRLEISFQGTGKIFGVDSIDSGTYVASMRGPGLLFGEGRGLSLTEEGDAVTWHGHGIGRPTGKGMAAHWAGTIYYSTPSPKLARLNAVSANFEWDVDEHGNAHGKTSEWK